MESIAPPQFYVYILCRPNGKPFYVGKGKGHRVYDHDTEARSGHNCHKCNVIRKIWKQDGQIQRYIVFQTDDESEAFAYEVETIALYGRANLANGTDGGEGISGAILSPLTRKRQSNATRLRLSSPDERARISRALKVFYANQDARLALSLRLKNYYEDPEHRKRLDLTRRTRWNDPRQRMLQTEKVRAWFSDSGNRIKFSAAKKAQYSTPEARLRLSTEAKTQWANEDIRAKMLASQRTPEIRALRSEQKRAWWAARKSTKA